MAQLSNALVLSSLKLGMVMKHLNKDSIAQFFERSAVAPISYPKVARIVVDWIESRQWHDLLTTVKQTWKETL